MLRRKRWEIRAALPPAEVSGNPLLPPELVQIFANRGVSTADGAERFLRREPPEQADPLILTGIRAAVERLLHSLSAGEKVAVYGDYDTDGVTATALLVSYLRQRGVLAFPYIPSRLEQGYGLNNEALRSLKQEGYGLVITVDCGIRSLEEAREARRIGLDLVITDHHEPQAELPDAVAVIDPKIPGDPYPDKGLAGAGVAYKLVQAVESQVSQGRNGLGSSLAQCLELVAVGTVADLAPLVEENRFLVGKGLEALNAAGGPCNLGLRMLMQSASLRPGQVTAGSIGFILGPRLNAAGRVDHALASYNLLVSESPKEAAGLAAQLSVWNRERQQMTRTVTSSARAQVLARQASESGQALPFFVFACDSSYHPGVIGLAASRLCEEFYRPVAIVAADTQSGLGRGSARSIPEFRLIQALDECKELLVQHGGHAVAAGFTAHLDDLPALQARLEALARAELGSRNLEPRLMADAVVRLSRVPELASWVKRLEPCGQGNPPPIFVAPRVRVVSKRAVGGEGSHLMLRLGDGKATLDAIAFGRGEDYGRLPPEVAVAFRLEEDDFGGERRLRLNVLDLDEPRAEEFPLPAAGPSPRSDI